MASLAAMVSSPSLPSLSRCPSASVLKENPAASSGRTSQSLMLFHKSSRVVCAASSDEISDSSSGSVFQAKVFPVLSSALIASALFSGAPSDGAIAFESDDVRPVMAVVDEDISRDAYINMLQNIKTAEEAPSPSPEVSTPEERARLFKEALEKRKQEKAEAEAKAQAEKLALEEAKKAQVEYERQLAEEKKKERTRTKSEVKPSVSANQSVSKDVSAVKTKNHGYMPLFLSQFLLLSAFAGATVAALFVPDSTWKEIEQKKDELVKKATPLVEDAIEKIKPKAEQAMSATKKFVEEAKPVVEDAVEKAKPVVNKAIENAKPLAEKALDSAKPLLEKGQQKASELLQQTKSKGGD